jgi:hypothetical protein
MQYALLRTLRDHKDLANHVHTFILVHNEAFSASKAYEILLGDALDNMENLKSLTLKPSSGLTNPATVFRLYRFQLERLSYLSDVEDRVLLLPFLQGQGSLEYLNMTWDDASATVNADALSNLTHLRGNVTTMLALCPTRQIKSASWILFAMGVDFLEEHRQPLLDALSKLERLEIVEWFSRFLSRELETMCLSALQNLRILYLVGYEVGTVLSSQGSTVDTF